MIPYDQYKQSFYYVMKDDPTWNSLSENKKEKIARYTYENQEIVADLVQKIIEEKELN